MSNEFTVTVLLRGDATQLTQVLDQTNQKIQQSGEQTQTAAQKFNTFSQSMVGMVGGFAAVSGGILGMVQQYTSLEKAQTIAQRSSDRLNQARITEQQLQDKVNQMQAKGLTGTEAYNIMLQKLELQHHKTQTAEETATIAQQRANEAMANFATQIAPQALSVMGGLASAISSAPGLWAKMQGSIGGAGGGLTSFITGPVGIALIGVAALATVLTLVATNAFGFRDALNAAGKALGDAVPFLQPLLIGIKALGEQVGLTGSDAKQGFTGMNQDVQNFVDEAGANLARYEQQLKGLGADLSTKNYQKFWTDLAQMMADNSASNVKGLQEMGAAMLAQFNANNEKLRGALQALGGIIQAGFQLAFGGLASWFQTTVIDPISKGWDALVAKLSAPLPKVPPGLMTPIPGSEKPLPPIWAPGGGIIPAAKPPPPPPTITGAAAGGAGAGAVATAAVAPATLAFTATATAAAGLAAAIGTVNLAELHMIPTTGEAGKSMSDLEKKSDEAYNTALKFAQAHQMVIPASVGTSRDALTAYINSHMDYQKELDKTIESNNKLNQQIQATSERLTSGRAAQEDYTAGVLEQEAALQAMQEAHLKSAGSLATLEAQIKSGTITNAAYAQGIDEQRKAFDDAQVAIANNAGKLAEYTSQVTSGRAQQQAYTQGQQDQYKAFLDSVVAISKTAGAQAELDRELATGAPQAVAYAQGIQQAHAALQKMATDTANIAGQVAEMDNELASGKLQLAAYNQGLAQGALDFDNFVKGLAGGIGQSQEMNFRLAEMARQFGALPPGMTPTNENLQKFITLTEQAKAGIPGAADELRKFAQSFDEVSKAAQGMTDMVAKQFDDLSKKIKHPLDAIPKYIRDAMGPDVLAKTLQDAKDQAMFSAKGMTEALGSEFKHAGVSGAGQFLSGLDVADKGMELKFHQIGNLMQIGTQSAVSQAVVELNKLGPAGQHAAELLVQQYKTETGTQLDAVTGQAVSSISMDPFAKAGRAGGQAFTDAFNQVLKTMQASPTITGFAAKYGTSTEQLAAQFVKSRATPGTAVTPATVAPPTGGAGDTSAATAALKALEAQAQAVMNNIVKMVAGVAVAFKTWFSKGAQDAAGMLNQLVTQAQGDMNDIAKMPTGVAASLNTNFASGANDAAGSLNQLTSQAQADMNNMAKMPTGVATSLNSNFNKGAQDAAGALNNLQSKAQGVMNNIVAAAASAARAVAAVGTAIKNLPNKTVTITVNNSQALSAIHSVQTAVDNLHGKSITVSVGLTGPGVGFLQHGFHGVVSSPHLFMIGEAGPERVDVSPVSGAGAHPQTPSFDRTVNLIPSLQGAAAAGPAIAAQAAGVGKEITIIVNLGGREIWREVRKNIFEDISQF